MTNEVITLFGHKMQINIPQLVAVAEKCLTIKAQHSYELLKNT